MKTVFWTSLYCEMDTENVMYFQKLFIDTNLNMWLEKRRWEKMYVSDLKAELQTVKLNYINCDEVKRYALCLCDCYDTLC